MAKDARKEAFMLTDMDGYICLFTNIRLDRDTIPKGLYCYDVRDNDGDGSFAEIQPFVMVNHWGTLISKEPIPLNQYGCYWPQREEVFLPTSETLDSYQSNNVLCSDLVLAKSKQPGEWICPDCGNTYFAAPIDVVSGLSKCPHCDEKTAVPGYEFLCLVYPELAESLIGLTNNSPNGEVTQASEMCDWRCPECHAVYSAYMKDAMLDARAGRKTCPYCKGKVLLSGVNSLDIQHPDVAKLWSHRNEKKANEVLPKSKEIGRWICPECYNEYEATIVSMTSGEMECPYCTDRQNLIEYLSLAVKHPDIAKLWSTRNNTPANEIYPQSKEKAFWICTKCFGEYSASVRRMVSGAVQCPYCNDRKALAGFNSFAAKQKELMVEWDYVNNFILADPEQILETCDISVWWTCSENPEHEYTMSPAKRILFQKRRKKSCPYCKGRRRKKRHFI